MSRAASTVWKASFGPRVWCSLSWDAVWRASFWSAWSSHCACAEPSLRRTRNRSRSHSGRLVVAVFRVLRVFVSRHMSCVCSFRRFPLLYHRVKCLQGRKQTKQKTLYRVMIHVFSSLGQLYYMYNDTMSIRYTLREWKKKRKNANMTSAFGNNARLLSQRPQSSNEECSGRISVSGGAATGRSGLFSRT